MRKILTTICALFVAMLFPIAVLVSRGLPADSGRYIAKKYAGWNGVIQAWVCCEWKESEWISWLKNCAAEFEKAHSGVYLEFTAVDRVAMREMAASDQRRPELVFFSPAVFADNNCLRQLGYPDELRQDLRLNDRALPVAMGGYIWVYDPAWTEGAPKRGDAIWISDGQAPAAIALLSDPVSESEAAKSTQIPEAQLDIGLPTGAQVNEQCDSFQDFLEGRIPYCIVTQSELKILQARREAGLGSDWTCGGSGQFAWTDQLMMVGCMELNGADAAEREELAQAFAEMLFSESAQLALQEIGVFSVTGENIYSSFSPYAALDVLLNRRKLMTCDIFSEYSTRNGAEIVRDYCDGKLTAAEAYGRMGLETN